MGTFGKFDSNLEEGLHRKGSIQFRKVLFSCRMLCNMVYVGRPLSMVLFIYNTPACALFFYGKRLAIEKKKRAPNSMSLSSDLQRHVFFILPYKKESVTCNCVLVVSLMSIKGWNKKNKLTSISEAFFPLQDRLGSELSLSL